MINHNIVNKIYNKIWLSKIREVNKEYLRNYMYMPPEFPIAGAEYGLHYYTYKYHKFDRFALPTLHLDMYSVHNIGKSFRLANSYNRIYRRGISYIKWVASGQGLSIFEGQGLYNNGEEYRYTLPKRYDYSSGLNHPYGYKDIQFI